MTIAMWMTYFVYIAAVIFVVALTRPWLFARFMVSMGLGAWFFWTYIPDFMLGIESGADVVEKVVTVTALFFSGLVLAPEITFFTITAPYIAYKIVKH